jgi:hypothetical protein
MHNQGYRKPAKE